MSHQNGYIYGPPPAPPPKATGPPPPFNSNQSNQFSRGNYGNRGRGNSRPGGRGNFNNRGGTNQGQGRGGYTNFGTHPPHASPPQPLYPVAGAYQAPAAPPYPPPVHQAPSSYNPPAPPSTFQTRPPHQTGQYQPPPQAFGHQPPPPQARPPYPQATAYNSVQTNSYAQPTNRWPQPNSVPPPPQHQPPTATPQPIRFFPQQPPPPTSYSPSQPPHPTPATTYQPNQPYGKPPPPQPQPHSSFQNQGPRPHHSYADLRVDGRVRPPAPPSVPTFFGSSSLPQPPPSLPPHPPPPSNFNQHMPNQQQRHNQHHGQHHNQHQSHSQHHGQHNRNRGNFGHRNNGFNHDRRNKDRGHRGHLQSQSQQFQASQNQDVDMSPEEYAIWTAAGSKIKGTNITLQDQGEIDKWLEERKKKWPTTARVAERKAEDEERQRLDQSEALKKKLDSLNQTESQLRKRKLDEVVDDDDKSKQQSKKKKKKKKKKKPQDDAPVAFEENPAAPDPEIAEPAGEPDIITVEEPVDGPPLELSESKLENDVVDAEAVTLAALEEDFLAMDELVESGDAEQVELITESLLEGQDEPIEASLANQEQGDVTVEEPLDSAIDPKDSEDKATAEADEDSESVAMSTSSSTADSAAESAEDGSDNESGSGEGSDESDEDAPPEESTTKPTGLPEKPPPAANPNKQKQVCKLWLKKACRYGAKCKYLHEGGVPKTEKERREEKKQQKETKPKEMSLYDKLMQAQMEKENVKLLQTINFFVEKEILKV
ncbi:hypothetical protein TWF192_010417 [Orbilia oligospora]|uniref:Uncharacterized protein n=2 Tax=Orbilia oligospora TaxID=2813651 RepID=A0A6G1MIX2_ORBOL|nr:hypothetical protein TWF679_003545 [Orbilia oligospora]KAF3259555.1 hypothetical protein TWF192_010417 [Orbilia oligospora]